MGQFSYEGFIDKIQVGELEATTKARSPSGRPNAQDNNDVGRVGPTWRENNIHIQILDHLDLEVAIG